MGILPDAANVTATYQLQPALTFERSVLIQLPIEEASKEGSIASLSDSGWAPLFSIPAPDRRHLWAKGIRVSTIAVRPKPALQCPSSFCGGDLLGT